MRLTVLASYYPGCLTHLYALHVYTSYTPIRVSCLSLSYSVLGGLQVSNSSRSALLRFAPTRLVSDQGPPQHTQPPQHTRYTTSLQRINASTTRRHNDTPRCRRALYNEDDDVCCATSLSIHQPIHPHNSSAHPPTQFISPSAHTIHQPTQLIYASLQRRRHSYALTLLRTYTLTPKAPSRSPTRLVPLCFASLPLDLSPTRERHARAPPRDEMRDDDKMHRDKMP